MKQQVDQETREIRGDMTLGELVWERYTDEQLVGIYAAAQQEAVEAQERAGRIEQELLRRAQERAARRIQGKDMDYVVTVKEELDHTKLPPLLEYLTPEEISKCYIPGHEEIVWVETNYPRTAWNMAVRDYGGEFAEKVKEATFVGKTTGKLVQTDTKE